MSFVFDKTNAFCISLDSANDRWERMQKRFEKTGITVSRWKASNGKTNISDNYVGYLNHGQIGCAASHVEIWRHIVYSGLEYALVLEDDACFDKDWKNKLSIISKHIGDEELADFDAIFLNCSEPVTPSFTWTPVTEQYLTGGYIISNRGARAILDMFSGCFYSSDWMTSRLQFRGKSYSYFPWLIIQEGKDSSIGSGFQDDHKKVLRCLEEIKYDIRENYEIDF
jgi:glycosyl transferase family 25